MARIPPVKMSYPCSECNFEAQSARQLSRHKAVTHVENALKCVLCPFVTAYQTNLLRHRREVHGICGSKGNKSCKFCGFLSEDNETLIRHQLEVHRDILKSAQVKFAKELVSAGGEDNSGISAGNSYIPDLTDSQNDSRYLEEGNVNNQDLDDDEDDDKNFWKQAYEDNGPNFFMNIAAFQQKREQADPNWYESSGQASPQSHENSISDFVSSRASTPKNTSKKMAVPASGSSGDDLPATRIRRQYTCNDCGFRTINPREFLYHRRDAHGQRLKIVECPYCVYACQYVQKLQRHLLLVHKLETSMTPPPELAQAMGKTGKNKSIPRAQPKVEELDHSEDEEMDAPPPPPPRVVPKIRVKLPTLTSPAMVATNQVSGPLPPPPKTTKVPASKSITDQKRKIALQRQIAANQKRMNDKSIFTKKYHKCQTCGYMTNVQYLFKKHMKYHSAPKIKCEMCDFESPYSWNVDRHVRSHFSNGLFKCTKCSFACDKKQALTVHMTQHHRDRTNEQPKEGQTDQNQSQPKTPEDGVDGENELAVNEDNEEPDGDSLAHLFTQTLEEDDDEPASPSTQITTSQEKTADGKAVSKQTAGPKKCKYCNFQTDTFVKLQKHEATAHPEKRFQCPLCEIKFENIVWLQRHLTHMHQEDSQACNIVNILEQLHPKRKRNKNLPFPSTSTPVSQNIPEVAPPTQQIKPQNIPQKRKHSMLDKSSTQCQVCGYQTRWISELEKHMRVHTKERPFACPYCSFKSKWKGDLNRHIQKYHSQLPMPDLNLMEQKMDSQSDEPQNISDIPPNMSADYDNDASMLSGEVEYDDYEDNMEEIKMDDKPLPDDYEERPLVFDDLSDENDDDTAANMADDEDNDENELHIDFDDKEPIENEGPETSQSPSEMKSGKVKMYRCSYCDFTCSTASRFHVHFVQHLNTKPFQCSVCGHRSNWEWDVTKHIKMKSQRDEKHVNAKAMLVHESGKRDYSKYNKYVVWVNQKDAMANNVSNPKIDFRAKRARLETSEVNESEDQNEISQNNEVDYEDDAPAVDPESIVITPDICFEVQGEEETDNNVQFNQGFNSHLQPNVSYNSNAGSAEDRVLQCSYCDFKHKESKVMVSHLSNHAGMKPYRCRQCGFDSNWREVVVRHCVARHQTGSDDVEQRFRCTVNKTFCKIVEENGNTLKAMPHTAIPRGKTLPMAVKAFQESHQSVRISGFKGSFVCDLCPFRAEKAFHMDFHVKRHQPSSGPFKCPHCPYWVNAKKSLVKHMLLHAGNNGADQARQRGEQSFNEENGMEQDSFNANEEEEDVNDDSENELVINEDNNHQQRLMNQANANPTIRQSASVSKNRCDKCPFIAGTKTQLLYHKQFHRPNRSAQFSCTLCTYSVSYLHLLNQHMKVHYQNSGDQTPVNYYDLPQEDESPVDELDERDESDIPFTWVQIGNNRRKLFKCRFCSTTSKRRTYIFVHERLHTQSTNETFKCSQSGCQFETRDSSRFLSHLNQHKTEMIGDSENDLKPQIDSPKAGTSLTPTSDDVTSVVIDVNNIRFGNRRMFSYVCPDCPAAFKSPGDLKIHSAFHNTEYDHPCFYCSYKAKNKPQLCKHLYVHTAEYIAKRANSYPDGTKLLIGNAIDQMKRDLRSPQKESSAQKEASLLQSHSSGATSLLKKCGQSPPWSGIAKEVNGTPKRAIMGNDGRNTREQMLLLEMSESNAYLEKLKTGAKHRFIYRCSHCPAVFMKVNTLTFHISMHGSENENKCKLCSYNTTSANNLFVHKQLHNYQSFTFVSHSAYNHRCHRCPAAFSKKSRLEKHVTLHGSDAKWKCDQCDYAVTYAATLIKHKACHQMNPNFKVTPSEKCVNQSVAANDKSKDTVSQVKLEEATKTPEESADTTEKDASKAEKPEKEEKILYCCDRCPYVNSIKDSVINHLKQHDQQIRNVRDGKQCPYCDYTCLQPSFLREHIQWHFEPQEERKASVFTYWNDMEVWKLETIESDSNVGKGEKKTDLTEKELLFKDRGNGCDIRNRFEPPEDDPEYYELYDSVPNMDSDSDEDEEEENEPPVIDMSDGIACSQMS